MKKTICTMVLVILSICMVSPLSIMAAATTKTINESSETLFVGQKIKLKIDGLNSSSVKWKSSKKSIASVNKSGTVSAKKSGKTVITGTYS